MTPDPAWKGHPPEAWETDSERTDHVAVCPECGYEARYRGDGSWSCTDCDWAGDEPEWALP